MRSKVTLLLLALNLAVFGYILLSERPWTSTTIEGNRRRVLGPEAANLSALEIATPGEGDTPPATVRLVRRGESWSLAAPLDWPANDFAVRSMLSALQFLEHETSFPVSDLAANGQTLAAYGLEKPRLVVTATPAPVSPDAPAPAPFVLRIGDGTAVGQNLYVLSPDGSRIHVVRSALAEALAPDLGRLRSDQLFTIPVFEARALTLQAAGESVRTRLRRDQNRWLLESPIVTRAAKAPVELAINDLNALRVARFLSASEAPTPEVSGLSAPRLRVTIEGNSRRETLAIGAPVGTPAPDAVTVNHYARLDERDSVLVVPLPRDLLATLAGAQTELRDRHILDLDPALVSSVSVSAPEPSPSIRIQKLDTNPGEPAVWRLASSLAPESSLRADPALVANFLGRLQLLEAAPPAARPEASPFVSDAPSAADLEKLGFNRPDRVVTLQLAAHPATPTAPAGAPSTLVLQVAGPGATDRTVYVRVIGQPFIYSAPPDLLDFLPVATRLWRDRALQTIPDSTKITRLVLRPTAEGAAPILDYTPGAEKPSPAVAALLSAVRRLRAKDITAEIFPAKVYVDGAEKPWAYRLEATLDPAPASGPLVLHFAERTGGMTQQAGSENLGLAFTLEQPVLDALWTLLYPATKP